VTQVAFPKVSVLMTVYNADLHLKQSLESLRTQEFVDFEVIVLEHGSSDHSLEILRAWGDPRMSLEVMPRNIGRTPALNCCLRRARGEYIAILDSDDIAHPLRFANGVEVLDGNSSLGLIGTWTKLIDENGTPVGVSRPPVSHANLLKEFAIRNPISHSSMMFRRDIALSIGGYDESYAYAQDAALLIEFAHRSEIAVIDKELCSWRLNSLSLTASSEYGVYRACDEYRFFRRVSQEIDLDLYSKILNLRQRVLTYLVFRVSLFRN
jgi:glycosyltransferase involved in cell wall biosynthesis